MDMGQYIEIFIEESREHLEILNQSLLSLEKDTNNLPLMNEIFRVAHTIKGMASTMGFVKISTLTHEMENLLQLLRNKEKLVSREIVNTLFKCFDTLDLYISNIAANGAEGSVDSKELVLEIKEWIDGKETKEVLSVADNKLDVNEFEVNAIHLAVEQGVRAIRVDVELNSDCMLKSARAFIVFKTIEKLGEIIKSMPKVEDIEDEKFDHSFTLVVLTKESLQRLEEQVSAISEIKSVRVEEMSDISEKRIDTEELGDIEVSDGYDDSSSISEAFSSKKHKLSKTVRVDIDRLDNLMNLVSELIIIKTRLEDVSHSNKKQDTYEAIEYLERITTNLNDAVMKVRMVPIERTFNRFPRMVRDLSQELDKDIVLNMTGEDTEVDRTVIDEIGDPLIHLIRNSIDHGIESREIRRKKGKSDQGTVMLKAYPDGNSVVIEVSDDGAGIDIDRVKKKALDRGLVNEEQLSYFDEKEAVKLLFMPGFSTASSVTDLSGRGVGLDVVKTKIEALSGVVEVDTVKDKGTRFIIRLPLTLAIIQALLVKLDEEVYAIPLNTIQEIDAVSSADIRKVQNQEVVLYRNSVLPIVRISKILGVEYSSEASNGEMICVIVKKGDKLAGLIVDELIGQQEIVIKSLGKFLSSIRFIAGATILGDGKVALILDTNSLL